MTKKFGWTKNVLIHHLDTNSYQRYLANQTNFDKTLPEKYINQAKLAVKSEYLFDFLELGEEHSEYELEQGLIKNIRQFLLEMGDDFCFLGNQYKLTVGSKEYFLDLLLYHRELRRMIVIELKTGEFQPEYAGKMQFYLSVLDDTKKKEFEDSTIGILICQSKDKTVVEYTLKDMSRPVGVSTYSVEKELPKKLAKYLPSSKKLAEKLKSIIAEQ